MICSKCKKRDAVVFISTSNGFEQRNEGLCLPCAKELGVPQVAEYMQSLGITDEMLDELPQMFGISDGFFRGELDSSDNYEDDDDDNEEDDDDDKPVTFSPGGAATLPAFLQSLFNGIDGAAKIEITSNGIVTSDNTNDQSRNDRPQTGNSRSDRSQRDTKNSDGKDAKADKDGKAKKQKDKKHKFLDTFCTNLTEKAREGKLDSIIGRDKEIERVIQILSRRTKNNPCLIGEPGVGKTAVAEGMAQRLVCGDVPFRLQKKELYLLDMTVLIAGTQFRGQFEQRVKSLVDEVRKAGDVILFIDEVHTLVGTDGGEGSMNAANMFKPALARGDMQVIGATTYGEYRKYIEKDGALERRFQPVTINEPTIDEAFELLKGIRPYYEEHHKVKVTDSVLKSCVVLSERYISDRFLPDKAIDLLDESAACVSIEHKELTEYAKLCELTEQLKKEDEEALAATTRDNISDDEKNKLYEKHYTVNAQIEQNNARIETLKNDVSDIYITEKSLGKVIELWTGIPASKITDNEYGKIDKLESALKAKVIGQDEACELTASAVRRTRVQLTSRRRPASFIFVGPTGVGKTELVKVLSKEMFDTVEPLIRLDMSEFMEKHSVSRIVGSPPGYVGYDEAGQLTEKVRRHPYSVILFDEIEKAHPDVMNILLQILDEGRINDSHGRSVNFEHTIIAMTSNAGSGDKSNGLGFGKTAGDISREKVEKALKDFLRPEFLSRIDEVVVFKPLNKDAYARMAELLLS